MALGKASTDDKCHFAIPWVRSCQYQCVAKLYQNILNGLKVKNSLFSEFEPRQNLDQSQMLFDYLMGYIMSISMCVQNFITTFHSVQEIVPFSLFQNMELGKASTDEKCHFAISWANLVNFNVYKKVYQNIPLSSRDRSMFTFSKFEPRQRLGQSQMTFDNLLGYISSISKCMQSFIKIFQTV